MGSDTYILMYSFSQFFNDSPNICNCLASCMFWFQELKELRRIKGHSNPQGRQVEEGIWTKEKMPFTAKRCGNVFTKNKNSLYFYDYLRIYRHDQLCSTKLCNFRRIDQRTNLKAWFSRLLELFEEGI